METVRFPARKRVAPGAGHTQKALETRAIARCLFTSEHEFSFSERTIFAFYVDKIRWGAGRRVSVAQRPSERKRGSNRDFREARDRVSGVAQRAEQAQTVEA